jgi:hypothetical protein
MLLKLIAIWLLLLITFPVARLCSYIFQMSERFLKSCDFESELKTSMDAKVEKQLDVWSALSYKKAGFKL